MAKQATLADIVDEADAVIDQAEADIAAEKEAEKGKALVDATDLARQMAKDFKVLLTDVKGTGKDGRVTVPDVDKHVKALEKEAEADKAELVVAEPGEVVEEEEVEKPRPTKKLVAALLLPNVIVGLEEVYHIVRTLAEYGQGWQSSIVSVADADEKLSEMLLEGWELIHVQPLGYGQDGIDMMWVMGKFAEGKVERFPYGEIHHITRRLGGGGIHGITGTAANALISGYLQSGWDLALVEALDKASGGVVNVMWTLIR